MLLPEIEKKYNFQYPPQHHTLYSDNMLYMGKKGPKWFTDEYPTLQDKPPLLLYANDFELLHTDEIADELNAFHNPEDYRRTNTQHQFVPFGKTGAGDLYCFYFNEQTQEGVPIVLVWHDSNKAFYEAKNLQDFIFFELLRALTNPDEREADFPEKMNKLFATHQKYITPEQAVTVAAIYKRAAGSPTEGCLTGNEFDELTAVPAPFSKLGQSFTYDLPERVVEKTADNKRRVGVLTLTVSPLPNAKLLDFLKSLNWRKVNNDNASAYTSQRKGSVIFGMPSMTTVDSTFRNKLQTLKDQFSTQIELTFTEDETGETYKL